MSTDDSMNYFRYGVYIVFKLGERVNGKVLYRQI